MAQDRTTLTLPTRTSYDVFPRIAHRHSPDAIAGIEIWTQPYHEARKRIVQRLCNESDTDARRKSLHDFKDLSKNLHWEVNYAAKNCEAHSDTPGIEIEAANVFLSRPWKALYKLVSESDDQQMRNTLLQDPQSPEPVKSFWHTLTRRSAPIQTIEEQGVMPIPITEPIQQYPLPTPQGYELLKRVTYYLASRSQNDQQAAALKEAVVQIFG